MTHGLANNGRFTMLEKCGILSAWAGVLRLTASMATLVLSSRALSLCFASLSGMLSACVLLCFTLCLSGAARQASRNIDLLAVRGKSLLELGLQPHSGNDKRPHPANDSPKRLVH